MNTYEKCCSIRHAIMTRVVESQIHKSWSDEFRLSNIRDFFSKIIHKWNKEEDFSIDVSDLTEEDMKNLSFGNWSEEDEGYLIPLWLYPFLQEEVKTTCIDGSSVMKKSEMDVGHRMGYLPYLVIPKEVV